MLKGEGLTFIRAERNQGVSSKTNLPFDFANITLSDGLESFKLDIKPELVPTLNFNKGQKCSVVVDVMERFNHPAFVVSNVVAYK